MNTKVRNYVKSLNRRNFTNNVQRVLHTMLTAGDDGWVSRTALRVPSASARIRDLRKDDFGGFEVQCASAVELGRRGDRNTFFYRLNPQTVSITRLRRVFEGI